MKTNILLLSLLTIAFQSCQNKETSTFWVSGIKTECTVGAGETICLQICKTDDLEAATWENFHAPIEGFNFEDGTLQKVEVLKMAKKNVPMDVSIISYTLVNVVEKKPDTRIGLHDIWACKSIAEIPLTDSVPTPNIEINLRKMMIMGNNGCNSFNGSIEHLNTVQIKFGPMAETKMFCPDMKVADAFNVAINNVATYKTNGLRLYFYDEQGSELLSFLKVD